MTVVTALSSEARFAGAILEIISGECQDALQIPMIQVHISLLSFNVDDDISFFQGLDPEATLGRTNVVAISHISDASSSSSDGIAHEKLVEESKVTFPSHDGKLLNLVILERARKISNVPSISR